MYEHTIQVEELDETEVVALCTHIHEANAIARDYLRKKFNIHETSGDEYSEEVQHDGTVRIEVIESGDGNEDFTVWIEQKPLTRKAIGLSHSPDTTRKRYVAMYKRKRLSNTAEQELGPFLTAVTAELAAFPYFFQNCMDLSSEYSDGSTREGFLHLEAPPQDPDGESLEVWVETRPVSQHTPLPGQEKDAVPAPAHIYVVLGEYHMHAYEDGSLDGKGTITHIELLETFCTVEAAEKFAHNVILDSEREEANSSDQPERVNDEENLHLEYLNSKESRMLRVKVEKKRLH